MNELSLELKKLKEEKDSLTAQLEEQNKKISQYESSLASESQAFKILVEEMEKVRMTAGLTDVEGRGVTVTLEDSRNFSQGAGSVETNAFLIHAEDILSVINELNVAGAEAVSINGQRIIGTSSVRCSGSVVNVNGVKIAAPFVVSAIGEPDVLESALIFPGGVVDTLSPWGIQITIKKLNTVTVPAYSQNLNFHEAASIDKEVQQ